MNLLEKHGLWWFIDKKDIAKDFEKNIQIACDFTEKEAAKILDDFLNIDFNDAFQKLRIKNSKIRILAGFKISIWDSGEGYYIDKDKSN